MAAELANTFCRLGDLNNESATSLVSNMAYGVFNDIPVAGLT